MEAVKRLTLALCLLCPAPLIGVSCGDPSLSAGVERPSTPATTGEPVYYFAPMKMVLLSDRGPRCATVWVGGVIELQACGDFQHLPQLFLSDPANGLIVLMVTGGDVISFPDGSVRILKTSMHYVIAQMSANMVERELRFTVTSAGGVRRCAVDRAFISHCR